MSALLLCCIIVLGTEAATAFVARNGAGIVSAVENKTLPLRENGFYVYNPSRKIVIEEVDKHGNSMVKELELPDYDEGEEAITERKVIKEKEEKQRREKSIEAQRQDLYGCDKRRESQRKKCLQRQKKFLKSRYRNWKALIRRIIKDLDGKIKMIGLDSRRQSTTENLNFMSGFSSKNVMRKKE